MSLKAKICAAVLAAALGGSAIAKVPQAEADKLKSELTPMGGEKAANADGTIPAWDGGLTTAPPCYKGDGERYCDPFPEDQPKFTITAQNMAQYAAQLTAGQQAMLKKHDKYKMLVYETRRTAAHPDHVVEATYQNALKAELGGNGEALVNAIVGVPFPIPKTGHEPVWNHKVRYRGVGVRRINNQAATTTTGSYNLVKLREDAYFPYSKKGATPDGLNNVILYFLQIVTQPARLAGTITLVHETMDQVAEPRRAWQYNPGQRRLRRAPNVGYDNPGTAADGLRTNDQTDTFNGAMDRYTWKMAGKKEIFIPYNSYKIHSDEYKIKHIVQPGHINQDLARYELHRVWVVEAEVKPNTTHIYAKRVFYLDEDSWQIAAVDIYDRRGSLWRWQETHSAQAYDKPYPAPVLETIYDLQSNRYLAQAMNNEDPENKEREFEASYFDPSAVQRQTNK